MNYFAHGRSFLDEPYFLAGTAVPDWLNVVDRKVRVRSKQALPFLDHQDPVVAQVARGITQHHRDDSWFHNQLTFNEMSLAFTVEIRDMLPDDRGFRPSFLGHILVELLLDAALIVDHPKRLDEYYSQLESTDHLKIEQAVNLMATRGSDRIAVVIGSFCRHRFLYDYLEDAKLLKRLNNVMQRVGLPEIPDHFVGWLPQARRRVKERQADLLAVAS